MWNLFNGKVKKLEREVELKQVMIDNRDKMIDKLTYEVKQLREEKQEREEAGFELEKLVVDLQCELNELKSKKTVKTKKTVTKEELVKKEPKTKKTTTKKQK